MSKTCTYCSGHVMSGKAQLILEGEWDGTSFKVERTLGVACGDCAPTDLENKVLGEHELIGLTIRP